MRQSEPRVLTNLRGLPRGGVMSLPDIRARAMLCVLAGYIMLNYSFMQLRVVIPLADMGLILCLVH
jgi:hypothetical protein